VRATRLLAGPRVQRPSIHGRGCDAPRELATSISSTCPTRADAEVMVMVRRAVPSRLSMINPRAATAPPTNPAPHATPTSEPASTPGSPNQTSPTSPLDIHRSFTATRPPRDLLARDPALVTPGRGRPGSARCGSAALRAHRCASPASRGRGTRRPTRAVRVVLDPHVLVSAVIMPGAPPAGPRKWGACRARQPSGSPRPTRRRPAVRRSGGSCTGELEHRDLPALQRSRIVTSARHPSVISLRR